MDTLLPHFARPRLTAARLGCSRQIGSTIVVRIQPQLFPRLFRLPTTPQRVDRQRGLNIVRALKKGIEADHADRNFTYFVQGVGSEFRHQHGLHEARRKHCLSMSLRQKSRFTSFEDGGCEIRKTNRPHCRQLLRVGEGPMVARSQIRATRMLEHLNANLSKNHNNVSTLEGTRSS